MQGWGGTCRGGGVMQGCVGMEWIMLGCGEVGHAGVGSGGSYTGGMG